MTFEDVFKKIPRNYEYAQMLGRRAFWMKKSLFCDYSAKLSAQGLIQDLQKAENKGAKIAEKIYLKGLDNFLFEGFKYEFIGFA